MLKWFKSLFVPPPPMTVVDAIQTMLSDHGLETKQSSGWLVTDVEFPKINLKPI